MDKPQWEGPGWPRRPRRQPDLALRSRVAKVDTSGLAAEVHDALRRLQTSHDKDSARYWARAIAKMRMRANSAGGRLPWSKETAGWERHATFATLQGIRRQSICSASQS